MKQIVWLSMIGCFSLLFFGCEGADIEYNYPRTGPGGIPTYEKHESVFGPGGLALFQNDGSLFEGSGQTTGIGVNSFLWRASLDTIAFMPLVSADPFGGVIITDWFGPPESEGERYKINVLILGKALRSDGVRATVFRQQRDINGDWIDTAANEQLDRDLEDSILTRARQLRINSAPKTK